MQKPFIKLLKTYNKGKIKLYETFADIQTKKKPS